MPPAKKAGEGDLACLSLCFLVPLGVRDPLFDLEEDLDLDLCRPPLGDRPLCFQTEADGFL